LAAQIGRKSKININIKTAGNAGIEHDLPPIDSERGARAIGAVAVGQGSF
jgi:hypothetical protein